MIEEITLSLGWAPRIVVIYLLFYYVLGIYKLALQISYFKDIF